MAGFQSNGVSLEDCLTNTFILANTFSLRWRCYRANLSVPVIPEQDPVLSTYSSLLEAGYLCAWQKASVFKTNDETPPKCEKQLWVFWYDKEPSDLKDKIHVDLTANDTLNDDNIKYEYKTIFYKALHNSIERHLLKQNYIRLDKWFVKPSADAPEIHSNKEHFSFCFSFFLHGDSNVCASVDITRHLPIRRITAQHVTLACRSPNSVNVMLAPHCLKATLTGVSYKADEAAILQLLEEWNRYYPIKMPPPTHCDESLSAPAEDSNWVPPAVEVLVGDVVMCYPSWLVVIASNEDPLLKNISEHSPSNFLSSLSSGAAPAGRVSSRKGTILTSSQVDKNAILMINSGIKDAGLNCETPVSTKNKSREWSTGGSDYFGSRVNGLNRSCLCCSTRNTRKTMTRKDKMHSTLHSTLNFHQRNSTEKKAAGGQVQNVSNSAISANQDNRLSSDTSDRTSASNTHTNDQSTQDASESTGSAIDPGSYPIMNELLGPPASNNGQQMNNVDSSENQNPHDNSNSASRDYRKTLGKVLYTGRFLTSRSCMKENHAFDSGDLLVSTENPPSLGHLKTKMSILDYTYTKSEGSFTNLSRLTSSFFENIGCDRSYQTGFGDQHVYNVYDFDDRTDFTESVLNLDGSGSTGPGRKRGVGAKKGAAGRGKDPNNQTAKAKKKRRSKNDLDSPSSESLMQFAGLPNGNANLTAILGNKSKGTLPTRQMTSLKSIEMFNMAEFVENAFDSSEEEDIPSILDPSYLNGPSSVKEPDSEELARMFPTPPSNNPPDMCVPMHQVCSPQNNPSSFHSAVSTSNSLTSQASEPNKNNAHGYGNMNHNGGIYEQGVSDFSVVLAAAAGLETRTTCMVLPEMEHNQKSQENTSANVSCSNNSQFSQSIKNPSQECNGSKESCCVVNVPQLEIYETPISYHALSMSPPTSPALSCLPNTAKRRKWDLTSTHLLLQPKKFAYFVGRGSLALQNSRRSTMQTLASRSKVNIGTNGVTLCSSPSATNEMGLQATPLASSYSMSISSHNHDNTVQFGMTPLSVANSQSPATPYSVPANTPGGGPWSAIGAPYSMGAVPTDINSPMSCQSLAPRTPFVGAGSVGYASMGPLSCSTGKPPTSVSSLGGTHSLLVNLYLSDSLLNIFTDINFDSCVICNCHLTIQSKDASLYLPGTPVALDAANFSTNGCECGFSALRNRHLAAGAGLFGEDEFEVVSRTTYKRDKTLLPWHSSQSMIHLIREQLTSTCSLLPKYNMNAVMSIGKKFYRCARQNKLQFTQRELDGRLSIKEAMQFSKFTVENPASAIDVKKLRFDDWLCHRDHSIVYSTEGTLSRSMAAAVSAIGRQVKQVCVNIHTSGTQGPSLPAADPANKFEGPLTWAQFYKRSGLFSPQDLKPLPVPSLLVAANDQYNTSLTPFALSQWEKLAVEPVSGPRTIFYMAVCPDDSNVVQCTNSFLKELSSVYQTCQLGLHVPVHMSGSPFDADYDTSGGVFVLANGKQESEQQPQIPCCPEGADADWWNTVSSSTHCKEKVLSFVSSCQARLPHVLDRVNLEPNNAYMSTFNGASTSTKLSSQDGLKEEFQPNSYSQDSMGNMNTGYFNNNIKKEEMHNGYQDASSPFKEPQMTCGAVKSEDAHHKLENQAGSDLNSSFNAAEAKTHPSTLVVYIVDVFSQSTSAKPATPSTASVASSLACLKSFQWVLDKLPEKLRQRCVLQLIPMSSLSSFSNWRNYAMKRKLLKSYCLSIYSKCCSNLLRVVPCKSLTCFGPSADRGNKCNEYGLKTTSFTPPYLLMPPLSLTDTHQGSNEFSFRDSLLTNSASGVGGSEHCNVLFVTYCLSHDHRWILVSCTDIQGNMLQLNTINVETLSNSSTGAQSGGSKRKSTASKGGVASVEERRGPGLEKLWEFVLSIISKSAMPWRVVIGRFGRLGHGEIKDWQVMLSKQSLTKYSQSLKSLCTTCKLQGDSCSVSILSVCLVSLESATHLQLFHDPSGSGSGSDGGSSSSSSKRGSSHPLPASLASSGAASQPSLVGIREISATHVLVLPTSANTQTQNTNTTDFADFEPFFAELFPPEENDDIGQIVNELSCDTLGGGVGNQGENQDSSVVSSQAKKTPCTAYLPPSEGDLENSQLQQQPLALGFYVSTAPTGHLPSWFWAANPLAEFREPATLKAALHITTSMNEDRQKQVAHPLDSHHTTVVLRQVLESFNSLSWLTVDPFCSFDRSSCLPIHMVILVDLYHCIERFSTLSSNSSHSSSSSNHTPNSANSQNATGATSNCDISPNSQLLTSHSQQHLINSSMRRGSKS